MTAPLLSIVVPFYGVQAYIEETLQSVRDQLLQDYEVILVDDGSPDGSREIAQRFVDADPRFRLVTQENQGLGPARNTGTGHATGKYITFLDSDDMIATRGYYDLVASLETSGSAFAAGNAWRFTAQKGTWQSWTHRKPFALTRIGTSLTEFPELIGDRMVWNKVYRRSFWDAGGFEFPAIKYEDYPVTLRAYLEAPAVDILHQHVYLWRDRESGDSITQQRSRIDNARDRFVSARTVLDMLAHHEVDPTVREMVHAYFQHIDIVALAEAMVSVPTESRQEATGYALELAQMIDPKTTDGTSRLSRLVHRSLLAGNTTLAYDVAKWRITGDTKGLIKDLRAGGHPQDLPVALGAVLARRKPQNPLRPRRLRSALQWADWSGSVLELTAISTLRPDLARGVQASAELETVHGVQTLEVDAVPADHGIQLHLRVDVNHLAQLGDWSTATFWLKLRRGPLQWRGPILFDPAVLPGIRQASDGTWVQPRGLGMNLGLARVIRPVVVETVTAGDGQFVLEPADPADRTPLFVDRPAPTTPITFVLDGPVILPAADLLAGDPPDNPVTREAHRGIVYTAASDLFPLNWIDPDDDLRQRTWSPEITRPTFLAGHPASITIDGTTVTVGRGWYGDLVVAQRPVKVPTIDAAQAHVEEQEQEQLTDAAPDSLTGDVDQDATLETLDPQDLTPALAEEIRQATD